MRFFHNIAVSVFCKQEEDFDLIKKAFIGLFPFDCQKEKIEIEEKRASTFNDRVIRIFKVQLVKVRHINQFMDSIMGSLEATDKEMMARQLDSRTDDEGNFFFRLSKKKLIEEGKFVVVDHGDCYHFKCHAATYPLSKEKAKEIIKVVLS